MDLSVTVRKDGRDHRVPAEGSSTAFCDIPRGVVTVDARWQGVGPFANAPPLAGTAQVTTDGTSRLDTLTVILRPIGSPPSGGKR
jgi:hypothetical protein